MKIGTIVKLKELCLGNEQGSLGVVYDKYMIGDNEGISVIFPNGQYDGFSDKYNEYYNMSEIEYYLEEFGFSSFHSHYEFKNVMQLNIDFRKGVFRDVIREAIGCPKETKFNLPIDHRPYIDKYFLRAKVILQLDNLNPMVKAQVFIRDAECRAYGIDEAIAILRKYSNIENTGKVYALKEGSFFSRGEPIMLIEAPIQDIIDLETMYLGVISAETTLKNGGDDINLDSIKFRMEKIVERVGDRPVSYFGARHWRYDRDAEISKACFDAGAKSCSTDIGAETNQQLGVGTIPHALECIYHWKYGLDQAVYRATEAFDKYMDPCIPRIALVDYANRELSDTLYTDDMLPNGLDGIRIDTCGENLMQGIPPLYETERGVHDEGVYLIRKVLNDCEKNHIKIMLSSGFGSPTKVNAFIQVEKELRFKLFDSLGVGGVFDGRFATMDIIEVEGQEIHKVGRKALPIDRLERII